MYDSFTKCYYSSSFQSNGYDDVFGFKSTGLPKNRIIGMGGALDSSRFRTFINGVG
jgi:hypothetical protein